MSKVNPSRPSNRNATPKKNFKQIDISTGHMLQVNRQIQNRTALSPDPGTKGKSQALLMSK